MSKAMRVFVTGATGWIGSVTVKELVAHGHSVLGVARSDAGMQKLKQAGIDAHRGDLTDPAGLAAGAKTCDAVIHLGFVHDFSDFAKSNQTDREAIAALLDAIAGTDKPFVGTNGTLQVAQPGKVAVESDAAPGDSPLALRLQAEKLVRDAAGRGVRASVVRLPPTVHGAGDQGFVPMLIKLAKDKQVAAYIGDGNNHWPAVHRDDAATLYRLAVESAPAGRALHGNAEQGITMRAIAETIGQGLGVPVRSVSAEEAGAHFGWLAMVVGLDNRTSNQATRDLLGWNPKQPGLLEDLRAHYF